MKEKEENEGRKTMQKISNMTGLSIDEVKDLLGFKIEFTNIFSGQIVYGMLGKKSFVWPKIVDALDEFLISEIEKCPDMAAVEKNFKYCPDDSKSQDRARERWDEFSLTSFENIESAYTKACNFGGINNIFLVKFLPEVKNIEDLFKVFVPPYFKKTDLNLIVVDKMIELAKTKDDFARLIGRVWQTNRDGLKDKKHFQANIVKIYSKLIPYAKTYDEVDLMVSSLSTLSDALRKVVNRRRLEILEAEMKQISSASTAREFCTGPVMLHKELVNRAELIWRKFSAEEAFKIETFEDAVRVHDTASWDDLETRQVAFNKMFDLAEFSQMSKVYTSTKEKTEERLAVCKKWLDLAETPDNIREVFYGTITTGFSNTVTNKWIDKCKSIGDVKALIESFKFTKCPDLVLRLKQKRDELALEELKISNNLLDMKNAADLANPGSRIHKMCIMAMYYSLS